jgi:hypothetical protein
MLIDDFRAFLEDPADGKDVFFWYGCDVRFPEEDFSDRKRSNELAKQIFADSEFFDAAPLSDVLDETYGEATFRFLRDCLVAIPPYPKTVFQHQGTVADERVITLLETSLAPKGDIKVPSSMSREEALKRPGADSYTIHTSDPTDDPLVNIQADYFVEVTGMMKISSAFVILDRFCGYFVRRDGTPATVPVANPRLNRAFISQRHTIEMYMTEALLTIFARYIGVTGMALNLMSCKNVATTVRTIAPKLQKARRRRGKLPLIEHKVLKLTVPKQVARSSSRGDYPASESDNRKHKRMGYLADYRQNGLFGKHKGLFWFPAWSRGDEEAGEIVKTYELRPAKKADRDGDNQ